MESLIHLGRDGGSIVKVLITSRPLPYIASFLDHPSVIELPLRPKLVDSDISIYVKNRLASTSFSDSSKQSIEKVLSKKSQGLFLYARLMLDEILQSGNTNDENIESILHHLPSGLGDMYTKMLQDHSARSGTPQDLQLLMLKCVTHSSRPLRLLELSSIVAFMRKKSPQDCPELNSARDTKSIVRNACGPLLEILEDETISIIHHSLTEFLTNPSRATSDTDVNYFPEIASSDTHLEIAKFCVDYLLSDGLADWESIKDQKVAKMKHPFLDYAANFWQFHVAKYEGSDDDLFKLLDSLLQASSTEFAAYLEFIGAKGDSPKSSDLQTAVIAGLVPYSSHLLKLGREIEFKDRKSRTLMHRAAKEGHHKIVEILLAHGAANNPDDYCGQTPLHYAASRNHAEVVSLLLKAGVDPLTPKTKEHPGNWCGNASRSTGHTPLQYACRYGHIDAVNAFLPFIDEEGYSKALLWALDGHKSDTALAILATGKVDVNKSIGGKTPLHFAAHNHDLSVVKRLLSLGADVEIKSNNMFDKGGRRCMGTADKVKFSPLDGLVADGPRDIWRPSSGQTTQKGQNEMENMMAIIEVLLNAGCNINEYSPYGCTALQQIFRQGPREELRCGDLGEFLKFMVSNGADPTLPTEDGTNVLHLVPPQESILVPLLELGLDVNCRDSNGRTLIFRGLNDEDTTRMLIRLGADCRVRDSKGDTTLHATNSSAVMKILLENGVSPDAKNNEGKTPLHGIRFESYTSDPLGKEEVRILLAAGADLESKTNLGLTKLHMTVKGERELPGCRLLIEAGADPNCRDLDGRTPLFHICETVNDRTVATRFKELVKLGADPHLRDFSGNGLFHQLAGQTSYYDTAQLELLELVLELGVSPLSPNNAGQTPLHIALKKSGGSVSSYKTRPVEFLLGPKCNADINASDAMGIRPIHEAVSLSEQLVRYCLENGADPLPVTNEGLNILHICSRARQSNIVGLVVDLYQKMDQSKLINQKDYTGKTPLHYAALSGRFESVAILLKMGNANPSLRDNDKYTPLHMCALFEDEDLHWSKIQAKTPLLGARTDGVLLTDVYRPVYSAQGTGYGARYTRGYGDKIDNEAQTVGVRQIIQSLVAHGADISFMFSEKLKDSRRGRSTPFSLAIQHRSEAMIAELVSLSKRKSLDTNNSEEESEDDDDLYWLHPVDQFSEKYCSLRSQNITQLVESLAKKGEGNHDLFNNLLKIESYEGIELLKSLGSDMLNLPWGGEPTCIATLASSGYAYLLEKFGPEVLRIDDDWLVETEKSTPNAPGRLDHPFIFACRRNLPNFEVVKVMVEKIGIYVNMKSRKEGQTALHILAGNHYTNHWWHSHAMNYLLEHGADPNLKNNDGKTPLHLAVQNNERVVEVLLKHGADPNILGTDDTSCLNLAKSNRAIVHQLIKHGVEVSTGKRPFLFDCVDGMDAPTINLLAEMGADFNVRVKPEEESDSDDDDEFGCPWGARNRLWRMMDKDEAKTSYPLHWAASHNFNTEEEKRSMVPVIKALLDGGANPMLPWNDSGDSVLHHTCEGWGILDPFMALPDLKLEIRDSKGRTLLLAAATTLKDFYVGHMQDNTWLYAQPSNVLMLLEKGADIMAIDNEGKNVLHHLLESGSAHHMRANHPDDLEKVLATDAGAKLVAKKDNFGYTPLHRALLQHQPWAVEPLLSKGADPLEPDPGGNTALHHLATQLQTVWGIAAPIPTNLLQKFIDFGVSINTQNSDGETPLFKLVAAEDKHREGYGQDNEALKHVDLLKMMEEKGGDLSVKNKKGQGLLHIAGKAGDLETFKYLVGKGLDPRSEDVEGRSALDCAMASGSEGILGMFKREG